MRRGPTIRRLWLRHPVLLPAFLLALAAALFFGLRALSFVVAQPWRSGQPVAGWMTPRYIQRTYDLPRDTIAAILDIDDQSEARMPVDALARQAGKPLPQVLEAIDAAIAAQKADQGE
ncbi:hypothetical protein [Paragemmobacter straminiformis]|uniref:Uncharacterized protein n=1 Tax=Paragemmobacter straminiformis TaxID=2045119 RepID=A0A842I8D7_9RHOB|nr:hypothetical protein [Gemmobacter straminiformis]MBC2835344.1 hypothetical protein [Gemmobacter straminiformis]